MSTQWVECQGKVAIFAPDGAIDIGNSAALRDNFVQAAKDGYAVILLDLEAVQYIDSSGLSALVAAANSLEKRSGRLVVCGVDPSVMKVFELTRLDSFFQILPDRGSALTQLAN